MINGKSFSWEDITVRAPWAAGMGLEILSINYSSRSDSTPTYGRGRVPRGYGRGNLEQDGSMELTHEEFEKLAIFAATQGGFSRIPPFPILAQYANADQRPQIDTLPSVVLDEISAEASQGDAEVGKKTINFKVMDPILYNGVPFA